jgi:3-oxoacyl-(acyl-carrier-protein) synthase
MPWISALKRTTGHALAASGLLEASLIAEGLRVRAVPSWPSGIDPALGLPNFSPNGRAVEPKLSVQIGQGMGGTVVVNLLGSVEA